MRSLKKPALAFDFLLADEKDSRVLTFTEGPVMKQLDADRWLLEQPIPRGMPWPQAPSLYLMAELYPLQQDCHE